MFLGNTQLRTILEIEALRGTQRSVVASLFETEEGIAVHPGSDSSNLPMLLAKGRYGLFELGAVDTEGFCWSYVRGYPHDDPPRLEFWPRLNELLAIYPAEHEVGFRIKALNSVTERVLRGVENEELSRDARNVLNTESGITGYAIRDSQTHNYLDLSFDRDAALQFSDSARNPLLKLMVARSGNIAFRMYQATCVCSEESTLVMLHQSHDDLGIWIALYFKNQDEKVQLFDSEFNYAGSIQPGPNENSLTVEPYGEEAWHIF